MIETIPITSVELAIVEPKRFPKNIEGSCSFRERREKANSGKDVPIAIITKPTTKFGILAVLARYIASLTIASAEKSIMAIPTKSLPNSCLFSASMWLNFLMKR